MHPPLLLSRTDLLKPSGEVTHLSVEEDVLQHTSGRLLAERREHAVQTATREQQCIQVLPRGLEAPFLASGSQTPKPSLKKPQQNKQVMLGKQNSFSVCRQYSWGEMKYVTKTTLKQTTNLMLNLVGKIAILTI